MLNVIPKKSYPGLQLKKDLGLERFKSVVIRKIFNLPINVYIVYFNSRFPNVYLPLARIKSLHTFNINRLFRFGNEYALDDYRMSPPMRLENLAVKLPTDSLIIKVDITGEFFANKKLYRKPKTIRTDKGADNENKDKKSI